MMNAAEKAQRNKRIAEIANEAMASVQITPEIVGAVDAAHLARPHPRITPEMVQAVDAARREEYYERTNA